VTDGVGGLRRVDGGPATSEHDPLRAYVDVSRTPPAQRPWVLANFVATVDGAVAVDGRVGALSSPVDKQVFRLLRAVADVVLVGAGTVRAERYGPVRLDDVAREIREGRDPPAVAVVSHSLDLDWSWPLFTDPGIPTIVITSSGSDPRRLEAAMANSDVIVAGTTDIDLRDALTQLRARGHETITCEGGPTLLRDLLAGGHLDELCLTIAPLVGGDPLRLVADGPTLAQHRLSLVHVLRGGDELFLRYLVDRGGTR
jgi:riboflavin biosynthesis pyrimidine reductase